MASRFENCVAGIVARDKAAKKEAEPVLEAFRAHKARGLDDAAAAMEATANDLWKKQQARAQRAEEALKWRDIVQRAEAHPNGFVTGALAIYFPDKQARGGLSAENIIGAYRATMHGMFVDGIDAYRTKLGGLKQDVPGLVQLVRGVYGGKTDATGAAAVNGWNKTAEFGIDEFIAKGGAVHRRDDWLLPNPELLSSRVQAAGKEAFSKHMHDLYDAGRLKLTDWDTGKPADPIKAAAILAEVVETVHTDGLSKLVPGKHTGTKIGNQRMHPRVLEFADADTWLEVNRRWGTGDSGIWPLLHRHIDEMATDIGLMHALGPNPGGMTRMVADEVKKRGGSGGDVEVIQARYDMLSGKTGSPVREWIAYSQRQLGALHVAGKLLSSPLSAIGDMATLSATSLWNGIPAMRMVGNYLKAFGPSGHLTRKEAARSLMEVDFWITRNFNQSRDMDATAGASFMERSADFMLKLSGAGVQNANARSVFQLGFLRDLGDQAGRELGEMKGRSQKALARAGIGEAEWDIIRKQGVSAAADRIYPEQLIATGEGPAIEAGIKLLGLINRELDFAHVMGDLRTQMVKTLGARAGTWAGVLPREITRFKSYSIGVVVTHINRMIFETQTELPTRLAYGLGLGTAMTVMSALSMQLRAIILGQDLRDMTVPSFWGAASLQGGGLGIFGDFIKSSTSRTGADAVISALGPTAGIVKDAVDLFGAAVVKPLEGKAGNWGREAVKFLRNHTPGSNLWFARRAIDGYLWDYLKTVLDPNYSEAFARTEARAKKELNTEYWMRPGSFGPHRWPALAPALGR